MVLLVLAAQLPSILLLEGLSTFFLLLYNQNPDYNNVMALNLKLRGRINMQILFLFRNSKQATEIKLKFTESLLDEGTEQETEQETDRRRAGVIMPSCSLIRIYWLRLNY